MNTAASIRHNGTIEPPGSDRDHFPREPLSGDGGRDAVVRHGTLILIAVLAALFGLFAVAYLMRMRHGDWQPLPEPRLLWLNTVWLLLASAALQGAVGAWRRGGWRRTVWLAHGAGMLALGFLLGQLWVWRMLSGTGYFAAENPATAFFFLLTGVHALHVLGGLVVWARVSAGLWCGLDGSILQRRIELCATYWHFLLLVWLLLLALFLLT